MDIKPYLINHSVLYHDNKNKCFFVDDNHSVRLILEMFSQVCSPVLLFVSLSFRYCGKQYS